MAATRIFHPFTGTSQEISLVWFSPSPVTSPIKSNSVKNQRPKNSITRTTQPSPATKTRLVIKNPQIKPIEPPTDTMTKSLPPNASQINPALQPPAEIIISRFQGKVIEVVEKKSEKSTFTVISSVTMKSKSSPTVVQTIRENVKITTKKQQTIQESKLAEIITNEPISKETPILKKTAKVAASNTSSNKSSQHQGPAQEKFIQKKTSSATIAAVEKTIVTLPSMHRPINTFAATLEALTSTGNKQGTQSHLLRKTTNDFPGADKPTPLQGSADATSASPLGRKTILSDEKQTTIPTDHSQLILHPPISGDLKLIITGVVEVKVEVHFKPLPKVRRSKALTRWESANDRSITPKQVRTKETVHEAVVEETEEGVYSIKVAIENGKPGTAGLTLKVHESKKGARSKDLGSRKINGIVEVAKVLMPEGILWNEDSNFTGDMEDADSITKFNSETGLMWREYK
jgi:hypothetical protein